MCKYSVIVPVYQAEMYLEECIESVLQQEEQDWELILVDDGSTDRSPQICDRYAQQYPKIKVLHKKTEVLSLRDAADTDWRVENIS